MDLVPAPAVRLMKRRVLSRPGVNQIISSLSVVEPVEGRTLDETEDND